MVRTYRCDAAFTDDTLKSMQPESFENEVFGFPTVVAVRRHSFSVV